MKEIGSYFSIIKMIAAGNQKLSKIAVMLESKQTGLTKYLKTLINLDILEREVPITEENPETSKKYCIKSKIILSYSGSGLFSPISIVGKLVRMCYAIWERIESEE